MASSSQTVTIAQEDRLLAVETSLGEDALVLTSFEGEERMSSLFHYRLEMMSARQTIAAEDVLGKPIAFRIARPDGKSRWFHGVVSRFAAGPMLGRDYRSYAAEVVPWLWFLTRTTDCRIFNKKSVPDVVKQVFSDLDMSDYDVSGIRGEHPVREYCVQYRETDFDFVSRLLEEEGIFYFFKHERGKHTLVLADQRSAYVDCADEEVEFRRNADVRNHVSAWRQSFAFRSGKWTQTDYDFEHSKTQLKTEVKSVLKVPQADRFEFYDYPGLYVVKSDGQELTKIRMEEEEATYAVTEGESDCASFSPGAKFTLTKHECRDEQGKTYAVTGVRHSAIDETQFAGADASPRYTNSFTCIPDTVAYRPLRVTPKPVVRGAQTAVVVGPSSEEIHCDKYGRVKVQFHWDREGKDDGANSCWIRVAQVWAGAKWGTLFTPRVGTEVIVDFLEGDPDRPIIIGCVYNDARMPPYTLPGNKTQSGLKTRSSAKGGDADFNELRFEDKKGSEEVYFHAQKDFKRVVEHDDSLEVGNDQTIKLENNRTETIEKGNEALTIKMGNRTESIDMGDDKLTIKQGNRTIKLNLGKSSLEAMQSIELKVGQNSIKIDQTGITLKGMMIKVEGQSMTQVTASGMLTLKGGVTMIN